MRLPNIAIAALDKLGFVRMVDATPAPIAVDEMAPYAYAGQTQFSAFEHSIYDGGKFAGGFGATQLLQADYWTLRNRSAQLFTENPYARGLIRRLITNEINTGLTPESCPDEEILGVPKGSLADWTENVENRFHLWGKNPELCDWRGLLTFGAIQRIARMEALIVGDVLMVLRQSPISRVPSIQLIGGDKIQTPLGGQVGIKQGHDVKHGVETDARGRVVGYWVRQDDGDFKRLAAKGPRSGRRIAWLVFGTEKRLDDLRGMPILSLVLQSLKEIDRYRDSIQRKAVINAMLAMFVKKTEAKAGTLLASGGAVRKDKATVTDSDGGTRTFNIANQIPGMVVEELQVGEEPVGFHNQGIDENFGTFENALLHAIAWANEIPPEILTLSFSSNYSASQAAINEFKIYLNLVWSGWGETACTPVYIEWLLSEVLTGNIQAPGLLEAWRNKLKWAVYGAWVSVDWYGSIKPATDMLKQAKGSALLVENGWSTNARESRMNTGTKFSKNVARLKRENEMLAEAVRPMLELKAEFNIAENESPAAAATAEHIEAAFEEIDEYLESRGAADA